MERVAEALRWKKAGSRRASIEWRASQAISVADQIAKGWIMKADTIGDHCASKLTVTRVPTRTQSIPAEIKMDPATLGGHH